MNIRQVKNLFNIPSFICLLAVSPTNLHLHKVKLRQSAITKCAEIMKSVNKRGKLTLKQRM